MATSREVKLEDLVRIRDPQQGAPLRVLGEWPGSADGPVRAMVNRIIGSTEKLLRTSCDIRGNRNFGPIEAGERLRESSGPTLKELNEVAGALKANRDALLGEVRAVNPAKPYDKCGHWQAALDLRLLDAFQALSTPERAATMHSLQNDPMQCWDLADAMLRLPRLVTGLKHEERHGIKMALFRSLKPDDFNVLSVRMDQANFAQTAMRMAVETVAEAVGTHADVITHAPDAFALVQSAQPLSWEAS
jgi:hypothetical protein